MATKRVKHTMRVLGGLIWSSDANIKSSGDWIPSRPLLHFTSRVEKAVRDPSSSTCNVNIFFL